MKFVQVVFPECSKNNTLFETYKSMVHDGNFTETCAVLKTIELSDDKYKEISNSLLTDRDIWENIGGSTDHGITMVVEVINNDTKESFFVNAEGFAYARYVGVSID